MKFIVSDILQVVAYNVPTGILKGGKMYFIKSEEKVVYIESLKTINDAFAYADNFFTSDVNVYVIDENEKVIAKRLTRKQLEQISEKEIKEGSRKLDDITYGNSKSFRWERYE